MLKTTKDFFCTWKEGAVEKSGVFGVPAELRGKDRYTYKIEDIRKLGEKILANKNCRDVVVFRGTDRNSGPNYEKSARYPGGFFYPLDNSYGSDTAAGLVGAVAGEALGCSAVAAATVIVGPATVAFGCVALIGLAVKSAFTQAR